MEHAWFITGSSRGLGRALVRAALDAGDLVAATARQPAQLEDLLVEYGERIHTIGLDVTDRVDSSETSRVDSSETSA
jgi:NAD(P)-dependent dehydrogenase (short-subunit alcohol dehydrogenase family)